LPAQLKISPENMAEGDHKGRELTIIMKFIHKPVNLVSKVIINILTNSWGDIGAEKATSPKNWWDLTKNRKRLKDGDWARPGRAAGDKKFFLTNRYIFIS
jgi:hypothetical protein